MGHGPDELVKGLRGRVEAVVIGGSAGAIEALFCFLPGLPAGFRLPVITVLHLPRQAPSKLVEIFEPRCALPVKEPEDKEPVSPGTLYFAPPDYHLLVDERRCFGLSVEEPVQYSRPSIDVLFESAAEVYGPALLCVVLSGANADGARGARAVREAGGAVLVQEPDSAQARAMPLAAIQNAPPELVTTPEGMGSFLGALGART